MDESILWTESNDTGEGFRCIRMVNNIRLNFDAFHGDKDHGGVHDGTTVVLWSWAKGKNQRWKIVPHYCKLMPSLTLFSSGIVNCVCDSASRFVLCRKKQALESGFRISAAFWNKLLSKGRKRLPPPFFCLLTGVCVSLSVSVFQMCPVSLIMSYFYVSKRVIMKYEICFMLS